jgi:ribosomal-protein-alanine N-acetyltransferase
MNEIKLLPLEQSHITEIVEIEKDHFATPWTRWMFEQEIVAQPGPEGPGTYAVVATADGRVAGYAIAWFIQDGIHLMNIAVHRDFQRRGIGGRLLNDLIARGAVARKHVIVLEVRASNKGAQAFYRRFGFEIVGVRRRYYVDNQEDAILMARHLVPHVRRRES